MRTIMVPLASSALAITLAGTPGMDPTTQTFVDDLGMVLVLDGEFRDGKMVLSGRRSASRGSSMLNRITWQKMDGDRIRQRWEQSSDEGKNWTLLFEGIYSRKKG